ncbi:MAG: 2-oxoglutarate and iron-dependent oxygenase domain-containing protein [Paracoccaceae bacterium]|nr:2-oxoglutarate and iron-dependent oxygenase domain-containing protein [Paracoccaceae bacterium]
MDFRSFNLAKFEQATKDERKGLSKKLDIICRDSGFLLISGHQVPDNVIQAQWAAVSSFFALSQEVKNKASAPYPGYPYGWIGPNREALAASKGEKTPPDLKESFNGGPLNVPEGLSDQQAYEFCYQPTLWPNINGFQSAWQAYYAEMERLAVRIMAALAEALGLKGDFFDPFIQQPISALRALYYPATSAQTQTGQQRAGAHTDYGSLTILLPQAGTSGLQILHKDEWVNVPTLENCFVINIGDLMALWTSQQWISALHRVVAIPDQPSRHSLAFFHQPDWDSEITPIFSEKPFHSVKSGPYLMEKFKSTNS